jgi:putative phosphoserine phosphatase / 1-acylglycerol-3-phosphate O-acyltransferase
MTSRATLTHEIDDGPSGSEVAAFFDVDRTLLATFSAAAFIRQGLLSGRTSAADAAQTALAILQFQLGQLDFSSFADATTASLRGVPVAEFAEIGEQLFRDELAAEVYPEARALVRAHQRRGHTVCIVSAATRYQIAPLARDMGIDHILCTELECEGDTFTGRILHPTVYGTGKADAVRRFIADRKIDLAESYFYSDSHEDVPLLEIVGKPRPTNPDSKLKAIAARQGWPTRTFTSRGTPGVSSVVRTSLAVGSIVPSLMLGVPAAVFDGSWRRAINLATSTWGELGCALAGVDVITRGEEHLWSHRPAVFIFNHQSGVDMMLICKLLRRDFVGVAKQEVLKNPIFGPAFTLAGTVFIDRENRAKAIQAMEPAVQALRDGLSIVIAPEGTRSATGKLGKFKKGAFHMALAAGAPIVPIVFKNASDALPKHAIFVRPATVEAVVHPPIETKGWTAETLDREIEKIRRLYEETLADVV